GASRSDESFVFDNEKWAHPAELKPFAIARAPVTQAEFAAFVEDGGYRRREFWREEGWVWRDSVSASCPVYWQRGDGRWWRRHFGCRQMIGKVWEWTGTGFGPYPGFVVDPYKEYSEPWFYTHKVLRGGCWTTRSRLIRNTWRNFYEPHRRDVWAGFRTCAKDSL